MKIIEAITKKIGFWEEIGDHIWKQQLKIEDLKKSRDNWKQKYKELKCKK